jgi:hypothetical protein
VCCRCVQTAYAATHNTRDASLQSAAERGWIESFRLLPDEDELYNTLLDEPALLTSLCQVY